MTTYKHKDAIKLLKEHLRSTEMIRDEIKIRNDDPNQVETLTQLEMYLHAFRIAINTLRFDGVNADPETPPRRKKGLYYKNDKGRWVKKEDEIQNEQ